jgi:iron complex outermembrane receptor protein
MDGRADRSVRVRSGLHVMATNRHWRDAEEYVFNPATKLIDRDGYLEIFHRERQIGRSDRSSGS